MSSPSTHPRTAPATPAARIRSVLPLPAAPSDGVLRALARLLAHRVDITEDDLVADLCCGSGRFTRAFAREAGLRTPLVAVDARASLLAQLSCAAEIRTSLMDPLEFARFPAFYDCVVMKDAFGEIRDPRALFVTLRERLEFGGRLAIVQSLGDGHAEPLIEILRSRGIEEIDSSEVAELQRNAGFEATSSSVQLKEAIPWAAYLQRLAARCLPVLHYLKDAELMPGIEAMRSRHAPEERVEITHHFGIALGLCR
jgi:SAM-dependent methyltransferase